MRNTLWVICRTGFGAILLVAVFFSFAFRNGEGKENQNAFGRPASKASPAIVVMELFTSQGCSSCPPADALLAEYAKGNDMRIMPLSFHVDYWDRLGWTDPFSNRMYSERQQWYSSHLPKGSVYTPQLIVNGRNEAIGSNRNTIGKLVQQELKAAAPGEIVIDEITVGKNMINFHYTTNVTTQDAVLNVALIQREATTQIKAGENEGVTLTNHNIVRSFITQPVSKEGTGIVNLPASFKASEYALVLYTQGRKDISITAAVKRELK
ncbi:MAG: DUF1223 domain-containing protein [Bacteroidota bacterium]